MAINRSRCVVAVVWHLRISNKFNFYLSHASLHEIAHNSKRTERGQYFPLNAWLKPSYDTHTHYPCTRWFRKMKFYNINSSAIKLKRIKLTYLARRPASTVPRLHGLNFQQQQAATIIGIEFNSSILMVTTCDQRVETVDGRTEQCHQWNRYLFGYCLRRNIFHKWIEIIYALTMPLPRRRDALLHSAHTPQHLTVSWVMFVHCFWRCDHIYRSIVYLHLISPRNLWFARHS